MKKKISEFNIIISGVGGQGLITLLGIIAQAALSEGYDVKTSELHGLSQRGGSVGVHIRFGKKIWSPLISKGKADLIIALESQESLKVLDYASKNTIFLVNNKFVPIPGYPLLKDKYILENLKRISKKIFLISASDICKKELGNEVLSGVYTLGYAVHKKLLPLEIKSIASGIENTVPKNYLELNKKALEISGR